SRIGTLRAPARNAAAMPSRPDTRLRHAIQRHLMSQPHAADTAEGIVASRVRPCTSPGRLTGSSPTDGFAPVLCRTATSSTSRIPRNARYRREIPERRAQYVATGARPAAGGVFHVDRARDGNG